MSKKNDSTTPGDFLDGLIGDIDKKVVRSDEGNDEPGTMSPAFRKREVVTRSSYYVPSEIRARLDSAVAQVQHVAREADTKYKLNKNDFILFAIVRFIEEWEEEGRDGETVRRLIKYLM